MSSENDVHIYGNSDKGYKITVGGKTVKETHTLGEAKEIGRNLAQKNGGELHTHGAGPEGSGHVKEATPRADSKQS